MAAFGSLWRPFCLCSYLCHIRASLSTSDCLRRTRVCLLNDVTSSRSSIFNWYRSHPDHPFRIIARVVLSLCGRSSFPLDFQVVSSAFLLHPTPWLFHRTIAYSRFVQVHTWSVLITSYRICQPRVSPTDMTDGILVSQPLQLLDDHLVHLCLVMLSEPPLTSCH